MKLTVTRLYFTERSTIGKLFLDDVFECFTLEPRRDQSQGKPYCIPPLTYQAAVQFSEHFRRDTPHLADVPGFTEIEMHPGNFASDTEGCTCVGRVYELSTPDFIGQSQIAFLTLMAKLPPRFEISYQETPK